MIEWFFGTQPQNYFFVSARLLTLFFLLPGFGEVYVSPKVRMVIALLVSVIITPVVQEALPPLPDDVFTLAAYLFKEILIGAFIALIAKFLLSALALAGSLIAQMIGFSNALIFDPAFRSQGTLPGILYNLLGILIIFVGGFYCSIFRGIVESYHFFSKDLSFPLDNYSEAIVKLTAMSFALGLNIAAPFVMIGVIFFVVMGFVSRLMPQMHILFIAYPVQIALGLLILASSIAASLRIFSHQLEDTYLNFFEHLL